MTADLQHTRLLHVPVPDNPGDPLKTGQQLCCWHFFSFSAVYYRLSLYCRWNSLPTCERDNCFGLGSSLSIKTEQETRGTNAVDSDFYFQFDNACLIRSPTTRPRQRRCVSSRAFASQKRIREAGELGLENHSCTDGGMDRIKEGAY